jgi:recombination protein RecT
MGTVAVTKRLKGIKDVVGIVIWEGDEFEFTIDPETFTKKIVKHNTKFENINIAKIKGAYGVVLRENLPPAIEIMSLDQIKKAWNQGYAKGNSPAHNNFTDEMCKKTAISRACKMLFNTSDDSDVLVASVNNTFDDMEDTNYELAVEEEIKENANKEEVDFEKVKKITEPPKAEEKVNPEKVADTKEPALTGPGF